jgi:hypothetical protein
MLDRPDLTEAQTDLIAHIQQHPKCAGWLGMGRGKTAATLTAFAEAYENLDARRMLVVAPKRVARDVWDAEIESWAHLQGLTVSKIIGSSPAARLKGLRNPADIHTINRENLLWLFSGYVETVSKNRFRQIRKWPWDWLALDEAQSFKNQSAQRTIAASRISTFGLADRIIELSGTPSPKGYVDLWSQLYILDHGERLGASNDAYLAEFFDPPPDYGYNYTLKEGAAEAIQERLSDIVLAIPDAVPPSPVNPIYVNLTSSEIKKYRKMERHAIADFGEHRIKAANAGVLSGKLLQLASGAVYHDREGNYTVFHNHKVERLLEALESLSVEGPVLVGYNFRSDAERICAALERFCDKGERWARLKSAESFKAFRRGEIDYGVIHPGSAGHGLNDIYLAGCQTLLWFGPPNNLEWWLQLNARIDGGHRRGKDVLLHVLVTRGTKDEDFLQLMRMRDFDETALIKALSRRT